MRFFIVLLTLLAATNSKAGAYKCEIDGKIEYRQNPCPQSSSQSEVKIRKDTSSDYTEFERILMSNHQVAVGMSVKALLMSWGQPEKINRSSRGTNQWVYNRGRSDRAYVYVENGIVRSWQD